MNSSENSHGVAAADEAVALGDPPQQREHQRDRELGRRARQHVGRVRDDDAARGRRGEIDVVDADRVVRDDAQLRARGVEVRPVDAVVSIETIPSAPSGVSTSSKDAASAAVDLASTAAVTWTRGRGTARRGLLRVEEARAMPAE